MKDDIPLAVLSLLTKHRDLSNLQPRSHQLQIRYVKELMKEHFCSSTTKFLNAVGIKKYPRSTSVLKGLYILFFPLLGLGGSMWVYE